LLGGELAAARGGEPIEAGALAEIGMVPAGGDEASFLQAVEGGIEGSGFDLEDLAGAGADVFGDGVSVGRPEGEGAEDEQVERALEEFAALHCIESL
jgi:hypothetical protein